MTITSRPVPAAAASRQTARSLRSRPASIEPLGLLEISISPLLTTSTKPAIAMSKKTTTTKTRSTHSHKGLSVAIIGDAFADLYCFLEGNPPVSGGDSRLLQPIHAVPGGSGLNTATHLCSLARHTSGDSEGSSNVSLHTVLNESDEYGKLLRSHANDHGFSLVNCRQPAELSSNAIENSTGHCAVIVSKGERSFMTHLGVVGTFRADEVCVDNLLADARGEEGNDHLHIHVAGYYNIAGFFDGQLKNLLHQIRNRRADEEMTVGGEANMRTTISLVPQHDATEEWDGGLLDLLPLIDYLILSELEAKCIARVSNGLEGLTSFFNEKSPHTFVIVTLGSKGAVALREGRIIHSQNAPVDIADPVDPTGAGDAFAAGFLHGIINKGGAECTDKIIRNGLFHGCVLGTSCVMRQGASVPASKGEIDVLIRASTLL